MTAPEPHINELADYERVIRPKKAMWSAVTCHRFGRFADLSAKQNRVPAVRRSPGAASTSTATSRLRKAVTSHRTPKAASSAGLETPSSSFSLATA